MERDWEALTWDQMGELAELATELSDDEWDRPSLCEGWRVRDVYGHMSVGHTYPLGKILRGVAGSGFSVDKASARESVAFGSSHTPDELAATIDDIARNHTRNGIAKLIPYSDAFVDHFIHELDVRVPLGKPRDVPPDRTVAALEALTMKSGGGTKPKKRTKGLRFVATDVDWSYGEGPEVRGAGQDLLLALAGRPAGLDGLAGDGADAFRKRLAA
jgi:uncharacterized protein (TIGR03083 family)